MPIVTRCQVQKGEAGSQETVVFIKQPREDWRALSTTNRNGKAPVTERISRGSKAISAAEGCLFEDIHFKTVTEQDGTLLKGTEGFAGKNGKKKITKVYKTSR